MTLPCIRGLTLHPGIAVPPHLQPGCGNGPLLPKGVAVLIPTPGSTCIGMKHGGHTHAAAAAAGAVVLLAALGGFVIWRRRHRRHKKRRAAAAGAYADDVEAALRAG